MNEKAKLAVLKGILRRYRRVLIAFSGGVDSTLLLNIAGAELGRSNVLAVTAHSPTYPAGEMAYARKMAASCGVRHVILTTHETDDERFLANPPQRCFHCKMELFAQLSRLAEAERFPFILDASNADDVQDFRPGRQAGKEFNIQSPLIEAGMTKQDIRRLSRWMGLDSWNKPANPCLASRVPYGTRITPEILTLIDRSEKYLKKLGFETVRVRFHHQLARIEVDSSQLARITSPTIRDRIQRHFKKLGWIWVTVDLRGYRTGSLNEALAPASNR